MTNPMMPGTFEWMEFEAKLIREAKGPEYTFHSTNRLRNFDDVAAMTNATPEQVLFTYMYKHFSSIASYCGDPDRKLSEPIESRIADMINYLLLLYLMTHRRKMRDYYEGDQHPATKAADVPKVQESVPDPKGR